MEVEKFQCEKCNEIKNNEKYIIRCAFCKKYIVNNNNKYTCKKCYSSSQIHTYGDIYGYGKGDDIVLCNNKCVDEYEKDYKLDNYFVLENKYEELQRDIRNIIDKTKDNDLRLELINLLKKYEYLSPDILDALFKKL